MCPTAPTCTRQHRSVTETMGSVLKHTFLVSLTFEKIIRRGVSLPSACKKLPQTRWLKTTRINSSRFPWVRSLGRASLSRIRGSARLHSFLEPKSFALTWLWAEFTSLLPSRWPSAGALLSSDSHPSTRLSNAAAAASSSRRLFWSPIMSLNHRRNSHCCPLWCPDQGRDPPILVTDSTRTERR